MAEEDLKEERERKKETLCLSVFLSVSLFVGHLFFPRAILNHYFLGLYEKGLLYIKKESRKVNLYTYRDRKKAKSGLRKKRHEKRVVGTFLGHHKLQKR